MITKTVQGIYQVAEGGCEIALINEELTGFAHTSGGDHPHDIARSHQDDAQSEPDGEIQA